MKNSSTGERDKRQERILNTYPGEALNGLKNLYHMLNSEYDSESESIRVLRMTCKFTTFSHGCGRTKGVLLFCLFFKTALSTGLRGT